MRLASKAVPCYSVITKIGLEKTKNAQGSSTAKATFTSGGRLTPEQTQRVKEYAAMIDPFLKSARRRPPRRTSTTPTAKSFDNSGPGCGPHRPRPKPRMENTLLEGIEAARTFFVRLHGPESSGHLVIWTRPDKATRTFDLRAEQSYESAAHYCVARADGAEVYAAVGLQGEVTTTRKPRQRGGRRPGAGGVGRRGYRRSRAQDPDSCRRPKRTPSPSLTLLGFRHR